MGGSGVVAVAEVVVYAGYLRRLKEARRRGRRKWRRKEIIKSWVIGGVGERTDRSVILQNKPLSARRERTIAVKI
jgi:hypothetical protein